VLSSTDACSDFWSRSEVGAVGGVEIRIVSRNDLIRLMAGTGRDRDLLDIGDLLVLDE
jgi:hypothetical protein